MIVLLTVMFSGTSFATPPLEIPYSAAQAQMVGKLFLPKSKEKVGGIIVVHDWMGLGPFSEKIAKRISKMGYAGFAVDMYGKNVRPKNPDEAARLSGDLKKDRALLRARITSAYEALKARSEIDPTRLIVIGYCFGGTTALELARSGAKLAGVVSFHGGLASDHPEDAKKITGRLLILHGADDPYVPQKEVDSFKAEIAASGVNMKFVAYPGAVHAFTNRAAGHDNSKGAAYNAKADKASWREFQAFLKATLR